MRRKLAAAACAVGLFAVAGCGGNGNGNGNGGASTEEVCDNINQTVDPLEDELNPAMVAAGSAAQTGDDAALTEAMLTLNDLVGQVTTAVRDGAADAEDEEFRQALEDYADEIEDMVAAIASGERNPDLSGLEAAGDRVGEFCG